MWDVGKRSLAPAMEETEGEDTLKHYTVHPAIVVIVSPAQLIFFAASSAQEKARQDRAVGLALLEEWSGYNFIALLRINFCVISVFCFLWFFFF